MLYYFGIAASASEEGGVAHVKTEVVSTIKEATEENEVVGELVEAGGGGCGECLDAVGNKIEVFPLNKKVRGRAIEKAEFPWGKTYLEFQV